MIFKLENSSFNKKCSHPVLPHVIGGFFYITKGINSKNADVQQKEYDNLLQNLSSGVFPPDVAKDMDSRLGE